MSTGNSFFDCGIFDTSMNTQENLTTHLNFPTNKVSPANVGAIGTVRYEIRQPYLEIIEQPAPKELRFRYLCEIRDGRSAGSLLGIRSTPEHRTFPTVRIVDYLGPVVIVVSCVTVDEPFRAHPHKLVGKEDCKDGICTVRIDVKDNMTKTFSNLGIQCVTKKEIRESLEVRQQKLIDPFRHGFKHISEASSINLNAVRLCFQAFLVGTEPNVYPHALPPVVSEAIYDKKSVSDLLITKLSHCSAPAISRQEMILLCEKVVREDIEICFQETIDNKVVWKGTGEFNPAQVHKQYAISFITPKYTRVPKLDRSVTVFIQLRRPSDEAVSEPLPFKFIPEEVKKRPPPTPTDRNSSMMQQYPQLQSMRPEFVRLLPPAPYQPRIPDSFTLSLPAVPRLLNPCELPNPLLVSEVALSPAEPQGLVKDEPEFTISSSELFPPNQSMLDPTILDEMLQSENMNENNQFSNNVEPNEESDMSDSLTNLVNKTFDREFRSGA